MSGSILISSAYLPPVEYFSLILNADNVLIEGKENYHKQTYRNRCCILSTGGIQTLIVPVYLGSFHKTPIKEIRIDYSKRWQQVHQRAIIASYGSSPFFEFYFEDFERIIMEKHELLVDLNSRLTDLAIKILGLKKPIRFTDSFIPAGKIETDYRYTISPKKKSVLAPKEYTQVFRFNNSFTGGLSIIDLIFNMGPEAAEYL
jgi:hypothetical protein